MDTYGLRPWTELVKLHPDVEAGALTEAVFAIDLGAIAAGDPNVPLVNRDPEAFFRATYFTADLCRLLREVLSCLNGQQGFNRVLKLRTPFGGGKSHTLAALLHAARNRSALGVVPDTPEARAPDASLKDLPDPGSVAVAVFDGEKFDARDGTTLPDGRTIRTPWGWLAWQLGEDTFEKVRGHDEDRVSPGGEVVKALLAGRPTLLLLDEVLKYMERSALDFFQTLTVEVAGSSQAAMAFSLQWSAREALGNIALLQELDKLASRVDQLREPVADDEVLHVLHRRLLGGKPSSATAQEVAAAYADVVTGMRRAYASSPAEASDADEKDAELRARLQAAYPFHPALIDCMRERWTSLDAFQRTRGALRFLGACLHTLKSDGGARPLLGPGDIPIKSADTRVRLLKELGLQNEYDPVVAADIEGANARAKRIDQRLAKETPALAGVRPAARLATAILMYSFGGLKKDGAEGETLPPGVTESELLASCVGPELDSITATAVLSELRNSCLYLHYDGVRYCFKKDPNVTKLIEDAEQEVSKRPEAVSERICEMLGQRLAGHQETIIWPRESHDIADEEPQFLVGYLPLEFAGQSAAKQKEVALDLFRNYGNRPRRYRNGIGLAVPHKQQVEPLRRAVRYLLAVGKVEEKRSQHHLSKDQTDQLRERQRTEQAAAESALRNLYPCVWLPRVGKEALEIEQVEVGGRPLQSTEVHGRVMELLTTVGTPKVHSTVTPTKMMERVKLGEPLAEGEPPRLGVRAADVRDAFFESIEPPRLTSASALRKAIAKGVADGSLAYTSGATPQLGADGKFEVNLDRVACGRPLAEDEVDLDSGFLMVPSAVPVREVLVGVCPTCKQTQCVCEKPAVCANCGQMQCVCVTPPEKCLICGQSPCVCAPVPADKVVRLRFRATRDQVFKAFPAIANLADKSDEGKVSIHIEAVSESGFDPSWLRNAVEEPLDEADIEAE
jgi:hypothetical protein